MRPIWSHPFHLKIYPPRSEKLCHRGRAACAAQSSPASTSRCSWRLSPCQTTPPRTLREVKWPPEMTSGVGAAGPAKHNMNLQVGEYQNLSKLIKTYQNLESLDFKLTLSAKLVSLSKWFDHNPMGQNSTMTILWSLSEKSTSLSENLLDVFIMAKPN